MSIRKKYIIVFALVFFPFYSSFAQFFLYSESPIDIDATFSRHSIESSAKQTFFNSLLIKNNANRTESFTLNITVPEGWSVIGNDKMDLSLPPLDSIMIPIRVAIGGKVRGDIGYSVIASLTDSRGNTIKNEYCFVKIPRETDLNVKFSGRIFYLDPISNSSEFSVIVQNKGNREEVVNFLFDGNRALTIGTQREFIYSRDVSIPPYTDSLFSFRVTLNENESLGKKMFNFLAKISTIDTTYQNNLWFRIVSTTLKNEIPANEKPLSLEVYAQGLLDAYISPNYTINMEGKTLFKGDKEVYYLYRNFKSRTQEDFFKTNRMYIGGVAGNWNLEVGDTYRSLESSMNGRGGYLSFDNNLNIHSDILVNRNVISEINNYGGSFLYRVNPGLYLKAGAVYNKGTRDNFNSQLGFIGTGFTLFKKHRFFIQTSFNKLNRELNGVNNHNEFGWYLNYSSSFGKFTSFFRARYGSDYYYSPFAGRFELYSNITWRRDPSNHLLLFYNENKTNRSIIKGVTYNSLGELTSRELKFTLRHFFSNELEVFGGPVVDNYVWKGVNFFPANTEFSSMNFKAAAGARLKNSSGSVVITPSFEIALSNVFDNPFSSLDSTGSRNMFSFHHFSLSFRSRSLMVLAFYTSGPRSAFDQVNYLQSSRQSRKLQFMPTFDKFVYKDILKVQLGMSYSNDMIAKSRYTNITGLVNWYLPKDWNLQFLGVYSLQNRLNLQDLLETYQTLYIEVGFKKEFNIQQPRIKYYNLQLVFFKDFNGNYQQEENEPGIKNVLVSLEKVNTDVVGDIPNDFFTGELMSDNLGKTYIENIPEGLYKMSYNPIGSEAGTFSKALEDMEIKVEADGTMYFPFVEKNKVFGKIILNRSKLSGLGQLDVSNVRITATDSKGRSYSTLTDKSGEFVIFAPVTDEYILTINNIFYENFDLRQNNFRVQFNGYKQFEVNYVFDEKVRRINFASTPEGEGVTGIQQVRRTNISGSVKDANSQKPIRARVNLVNTRTNSIVTSTYSSATSGEYTMSFMAGDNYLLEVLADDYWYLSENLVLNQVTTFMNISRDVMLKPISVGSKVELNIQFEANSEFLAPQSVAELNRLLRLVKDNPTVKLEVQGHCDDIEALQKPEIALERAKAVSKYLIENGYSNLEIKSLGNTVPIASNDTEEGRSRNRRVEVEVISK